MSKRLEEKYRAARRKLGFQARRQKEGSGGGFWEEYFEEYQALYNGMVRQTALGAKHFLGPRSIKITTDECPPLPSDNDKLTLISEKDGRSPRDEERNITREVLIDLCEQAIVKCDKWGTAPAFTAAIQSRVGSA